MSDKTTECFICGQDCSNAWGTYLGYICHIGCLPVTKQEAARFRLAVRQLDDGEPAIIEGRRP